MQSQRCRPRRNYLGPAVYRLLAEKFPIYEKVANLTEPSPEFRLVIAAAVAEFLVSAQPPNAKRRRSDLKRRERIARQAKAGLGKRDRDRVFTAWMVESLALAELPKNKRRPKLEAQERFIRVVAASYFSMTGKRPTIGTDGGDKEYVGPFADLLLAIDHDMRPLIRSLRPDAVSLWSASIVRYAKSLKLGSKTQPPRYLS